MTLEQVLAFLRANQPMPNFPDPNRMQHYRDVVTYLHHHPDPACLPYLIHSFSAFADWKIYDRVQAVICCFRKSLVLPALIDGMKSPHFSVRFWSADTARFMPDEALIPHLEILLAESSPEIRMVAVAALETIDSPRVRYIVREALTREDDGDVVDVMRDLIGETGSEFGGSPGF